MSTAKTARLVHHDDGKGKWQSHEVYLQYPEFSECLMKFEGRGYGETLEEAFKDFREQYQKALKEAEALATMVLDTDALWPPTEVDCLGKEV